MKSKKYFLIVIVVSFISIGTLAITKIANHKPVQKQTQSVNDSKQAVPVADNEMTTDDDPWKEIENIVKHYYSKEGIGYSGTMKLMDENKDDEKVLEEMKFDYTLLGDEYYYKMGNFEVVNKNNFVLAVDNDSKTIALSYQPPSSVKAQLFNPTEFKKLAEQKGAATKVTQAGGEKIITIDSIQDPQIQGYRIYYSPSTYQIHKIEIGMVRLSPVDGDEDNSDQEQTSKPSVDSKDQNKEDDSEPGAYTYLLEVTYSSIKSLSLRKDEFNPENKFITVTKNNIQLTPAYSNYTLLNSGE
jgi:hypothetical protein